LRKLILFYKKVSQDFFFVITLLAVLAVAAVPVRAAPTPFTVHYMQAQFQWRAAFGAFGTWSLTYQNWATSADFKLSALSLRTSISYSPSVTDLVGALPRPL